MILLIGAIIETDSISKSRISYFKVFDNVFNVPNKCIHYFLRIYYISSFYEINETEVEAEQNQGKAFISGNSLGCNFVHKTFLE